MAKDIRPAWQQVLLVALNNVPKGKDGRAAWDKLNAEEQSAVMQFLGDQCGHDPKKAQGMLAETTGMLKPGKRRAWLWVLLAIVIGTAVAIWGIHMLGERFGDLHGYVTILLCLSRLEQAWNVTPVRHMVQVWMERTSNYAGTVSALNEMYRIVTLPKKELRSKAALVLWAALLAILVILTFVIA